MALFKKKQEDLSIPPPPVRPAPLKEVGLPETPDQLPSFEEMREKELPPMPDMYAGPVVQAPEPIMPSRPPIPDMHNNSIVQAPEPMPSRPLPKAMPKTEMQMPVMRAPPRPPTPTFAPEISTRYEESQYADEKEELEELSERNFTGRPIYVLMSQYKQIIGDVTEARNILKTAEENASNLNNIKNKTDKEFGSWRQAMEEIQRKIIFIDKTLFER